MENTAVLEAVWEEAEVETSPEVAPRRRRLAPLWRLAGPDGRGLASAAEWLFGVVSLLVGLATLAALPMAQFLSLGYFLESSARVARTRPAAGRLRRRPTRGAGRRPGGGDLAGDSVPAWLVGSFARSAELIDPGGPAARGWRVVLVVVAVLTFCHVLSPAPEAADCGTSSGRSAIRSGWSAGCGQGDCTPSSATASGSSWPRCGSRTISVSDWWGFSARSPG